MKNQPQFKGWPIVFWIVAACSIACLVHGRTVHRSTEFIPGERFNSDLGK